jgi:hypothetical protein
VIYGGRDWDDQEVMDRVLDGLHEVRRFSLVVNGGQVSRDREVGRLWGADWQASVWAASRGVPVRWFYANWSGEGRKAGPLRNQRMVDEGLPEVGVQFPGGRGTRDMRRKMKAAGIRVIEVNHEGLVVQEHPDLWSVGAGQV